ncbi:MAG: tRNA glutamyl-Q(34) synthetase GluQRS [Gammaproteobacteria bacterium]|nr:tRNA glutamyl-Q(34) synthetase GluQRS [Gammaproteobacteria bacterium]
MSAQTRRGRFAPSPTGPLHIGSLVAALGSYLNAHRNQAEWLVRIDDLDPPREQPGAADAILRSLAAHGLHWHGEVMYQSRRSDAYEAAITELVRSGLAYYCRCSRKQIEQEGTAGEFGAVYNGHCRKLHHQDRDAALRVIVDDQAVTVHDRIQGDYTQILDRDIGDFVIKRRDGLYAYHLAAVVDDAEQGITEIVRGVDLLDSTPRQCYLQTRLNLPTPEYAHLPVVMNELGQKLSKQNLAPPLDDHKAGSNLCQALVFLNQDPPESLGNESVTTILDWALDNWKLESTTTARR